VNVTTKFSEDRYTNVFHSTHYISAVTVTPNFLVNITTKCSNGHFFNNIAVASLFLIIDINGTQQRELL